MKLNKLEIVAKLVTKKSIPLIVLEVATTTIVIDNYMAVIQV
jgi:hypothetical protein